METFQQLVGVLVVSIGLIFFAVVWQLNSAVKKAGSIIVKNPGTSFRGFSLLWKILNR